jgi:DNA helicase IV
VGDRNQQVTEKKGALDRLIALGVRKSELTTHYRNGLKICRVADGIKNLIDKPEGMEATSNYDEATFPSTVDVFGNITLKDQIESAVPRIETQLQAYPGEMIGLICPRLVDLDEAKLYLESSTIADYLHVQRSGAYGAFSPERNVLLSSAVGAKGLEFRAVHVFAAEKLKRFQTQKNLTYTSVTRCKTSLSIYHDGDLAGYFEKGLGACALVKPTVPTLDELFR